MPCPIEKSSIRSIDDRIIADSPTGYVDPEKGNSNEGTDHAPSAHEAVRRFPEWTTTLGEAGAIAGAMSDTSTGISM
jgi:hypothetical protein